MKSKNKTLKHNEGFTSVNVNYTCKVKLTKYGIKVWKEHWEPYRKVQSSMNLKVNSYFDKPKLDSNGYMVTALWEIMQIFGKCLYMGNNEIPFVNNEILIEEVL